jgi:hypothetical protein
VDIFRATVGEETEQSLDKKQRKHVKQLIKRENELLNKSILPTEPLPKNVKLAQQCVYEGVLISP